MKSYLCFDQRLGSVQACRKGSLYFESGVGTFALSESQALQHSESAKRPRVLFLRALGHGDADGPVQNEFLICPRKNTMRFCGRTDYLKSDTSNLAAQL